LLEKQSAKTVCRLSGLLLFCTALTGSTASSFSKVPNATMDFELPSSLVIHTAVVQIGRVSRLRLGFDEHEPAMSKLKDIEWLFNGRRFDRGIIVLCVRWYLRYKLSLRDLVEMMAGRGLSLSHTTIMRWVNRFTPEFVKRWDRYARSTGRSWRVDETYGTPSQRSPPARGWSCLSMFGIQDPVELML
jgi:hypothetical protein